MAGTYLVDYIYPPGLLDGVWEEKSGNHRIIVRLAGVQTDGTGETDVIKIAMSDLKTPAGNVPGRTAVEYIEWQVLGMTVALEWDRAPHAEIFRINAHGSESHGNMDWRKSSGKVDPGGDDRTGDILLTTTNVDAGDSYDVTLHLRLKDPR